jgi:hypothetical protein
MKRFVNETFSFIDDADSAALFSDIECDKCHFEGCSISIARQPRLRTRIRNVKLFNCSQRGCTVFAGVFENCIVDGLDTKGVLVQTWGAVFKHVVLRGKIGEIMVSDRVDILGTRPGQQEAFDRANGEFYKGVDWALDISEAEVESLDLRGVPAKLVRRDPETQVVVTRETVLRVPWNDVKLNETLWKTTIRVFIDQGYSDTVLVAPKRDQKFVRLVADLRTLQAAGVAEPD